MPKPKSTKAKKIAEIHEWFDHTCNVNNPAHRDALKRAATLIYSRQTAQEQDSERTIELNGIGFNGRDGGFGARIARWRGDMTLKMAVGAKKMLRKYARQLAEIKLGH